MSLKHINRTIFVLLISMVSAYSYSELVTILRSPQTEDIGLTAWLQKRSLTVSGNITLKELRNTKTYFLNSNWVLTGTEIKDEDDLNKFLFNEPYFIAVNPKVNPFLKDKHTDFMVTEENNSVYVYVLTKVSKHVSLREALDQLDNYQNRIIWRLDVISDLLDGLTKLLALQGYMDDIDLDNIHFKYQRTYEDPNNLPYIPMLNLFHNTNTVQLTAETLMSNRLQVLKIVLVYLVESIYNQVKAGEFEINMETVESLLDCKSAESLVKNDPYYCTHFAAIVKRFIADPADSNVYALLTSQFKAKAIRLSNALGDQYDNKARYLNDLEERFYDMMGQGRHPSQDMIDSTQNGIKAVKEELSNMKQPLSNLLKDKEQVASSFYNDNKFSEFMTINKNSYSEIESKLKQIDAKKKII